MLVVLRWAGTGVSQPRERLGDPLAATSRCRTLVAKCQHEDGEVPSRQRARASANRSLQTTWRSCGVPRPDEGGRLMLHRYCHLAVMVLFLPGPGIAQVTSDGGSSSSS